MATIPYLKCHMNQLIGILKYDMSSADETKKYLGQPPSPSYWLSQTATPLTFAVIGQIWALRHQGGKEAAFWLDEPTDCW